MTMISQDYGYLITQLEKRLAKVEKRMPKLKDMPAISSQDWDNATLLREWEISKRTAANYRKHGLEYFKRGGRIYYSQESRRKFIKTKKG